MEVEIDDISRKIELSLTQQEETRNRNNLKFSHFLKNWSPSEIDPVNATLPSAKRNILENDR